MTLDSVLATLFIMFLYVLKPGPSILAVISRALSDGFFAGFSVALGNTTAHLIYFFLALFGYALIEAHLEFASFLLKSVGAVYIFYIGIKGLLNLEAGSWGGKPDQTMKISFFENYLSGLAICISSPYTILFYIAIVPQMLPLSQLHGMDIAFATLLVAGTYLTLHSTISYLCGFAKQALKNEAVVRKINLTVSLIFIGLGVFMIVSLFPIFDFDLNNLGVL